MKEGWVEKKFGDPTLFKIIDGDRGKNYPKQSDFLPEGYCLFLNTKNVRPDGFNFDTTMFVDKDKDEKLRKGKLKRRDVILTTRGTIGNVAIYDDSVEFDNIRINSGMLIFRPNEYVITSEYLFKILLSPVVKQQISESTSGAAQPQLPIKTLVNFTIPVPPVFEQKRIVAILDEVFEGIDRAIANTEKNLTNARELFESYLNAIFTQKSDYLGDLKSQFVPLSTLLSEQPRNGWSPPAIFQTGEGIPVLTLSAVTGFNYDGSRVKLTSAPTKEKAHYWLKKGELLITRSNTPELVGHVAIYDGNPQQAICCDLIMKMTLDSTKADTRFIYYYLRSFAARRYLMSNATGASATMPKINKQVVQNTPIPIFSVAEQKNIVVKLDEIAIETQCLEAIYRQKLAALNELKQSILQKAFTGELTSDHHQTTEAAEENHRISKDCLPSAEAVKQSVHPSGQLSLWA
jgi:type I restriction enzyme, S subunit